MSSKTKQAIFIRHGQSRQNVGDWDGGFAEIPLTAIGEEQARLLAESWEFTPSLIVVSPYLRTQQTAAPTIARFPQVPVETWDIHEFTYWDRAHWNDVLPDESFEEVERYWRVADPAYRHKSDARNGGAESFGDLLKRTEVALESNAMEFDSPVLLFTHGHFMQALRHTLLFPHWTAEQKMMNFRAYDEANKVLNTELITVGFEDGKWRLG